MEDRKKIKNFKMKGDEKEMRINEKGITLIALIITIIILVILAAVSIRAVANMGIVGHAINGTQQYARAQKDEEDLFDRITKLLDNTLIEINGIEDGCGITLNKDKLGLLLEGNKTVTEKLVATVVNLEGDVSWTSSKPEVAEVSEDGTVTALSLGETVITAKIEYDGKEYSASCNVEVTNVPVTSVEVEPTSVTLDKGEEATLTASVGPENVTNKAVTWSSEDENVATVDANGKVRAVAGGTTRIIATANDGSGYSANCIVTVVIHPTIMTILATGNKTEIDVDEELQLSVTTDPEVITDTITWSSSDTSKATVNNTGLVKGVSEGTATITATAKDGNNDIKNTATYVINVNTSNNAGSVLKVGDYVNLTRSNGTTSKCIVFQTSDIRYVRLIETATSGSVTLNGETFSYMQNPTSYYVSRKLSEYAKGYFPNSPNAHAPDESEFDTLKKANLTSAISGSYWTGKVTDDRQYYRT